MADGTFTDLRTHWFGHIGAAGIGVARHAGGVLTVGRDGPIPAIPGAGADLPHLIRLALRVRLRCRRTEGARDHGQLVEVRQEADLSPKFSFLEEGPVRVGPAHRLRPARRGGTPSRRRSPGPLALPGRRPPRHLEPLEVDLFSDAVHRSPVSIKRTP